MSVFLCKIAWSLCAHVVFRNFNGGFQEPRVDAKCRYCSVKSHGFCVLMLCLEISTGDFKSLGSTPLWDANSQYFPVKSHGFCVLMLCLEISTGDFKRPGSTLIVGISLKNRMDAVC